MERDIHARLKQVWSHLPKDWDVVFLGHGCSDESFYPALNAHVDPTAPSGTVTRIHPSRSPWYMHAYALTRASARRLLVKLRYPPFAYSRALDLALSWLIQSGKINSFSIVPSLIAQRQVSASDITPGAGSDVQLHLVNGVFGSAGKAVLDCDRAHPLSLCFRQCVRHSVGPEALQMGSAKLEGFMKVEGLNI